MTFYYFGPASDKASFMQACIYIKPFVFINLRVKKKNLQFVIRITASISTCQNVLLALYSVAGIWKMIVGRMEAGSCRALSSEMN